VRGQRRIRQPGSDRAKVLPPSQRYSLRMGAPRSSPRSMVFGNMGNHATGVAFKPAPPTGDSAYYGDADQRQGEDVVAGIRTPQYLSKASARTGQCQSRLSMKRRMPRPKMRITDHVL